MNTTNAFANETSKMIDVLKKAHQEIEAIEMPSDAVPLKTRVLNDFKKHITMLCINNGEALDHSFQVTETRFESQPLLKIMGRDVSNATAPEPAFISEQEEIEKQDAIEADEVYNRFLILTNEDILTAISPDIVRAVAKKAGFVDADIPDSVNAEFIDAVKTAIQTEKAPKFFKTSKEILFDEIAAKVTKLHDNFLTIESDVILSDYSDIEVRAVAKKAGLPVTETSPKKLDIKFINQVKEAIKKTAEIQKLGE